MHEYFDVRIEHKDVVSEETSISQCWSTHHNKNILLKKGRQTTGLQVKEGHKMVETYRSVNRDQLLDEWRLLALDEWMLLLDGWMDKGCCSWAPNMALIYLLEAGCGGKAPPLRRWYLWEHLIPPPAVPDVFIMTTTESETVNLFKNLEHIWSHAMKKLLVGQAGVCNSLQIKDISQLETSSSGLEYNLGEDLDFGTSL